MGPLIDPRAVSSYSQAIEKARKAGGTVLCGDKVRPGAGNYVEGGVDVTLPFEVTGSGRVGYQWIQNNPRFGTPDYLWYSVGVSREIYAGFTGTLAWYGTNIDKKECVPVAGRADGGQRICEGRVLFTLSKIF